jgi:glycosyltransferase involved in cell wall biosynthesis
MSGDQEPNTKTTGVSVVTTTLNESSTISELILEVRTVLQGVPHEIIVVDDESQDGTIDIAKPLADIVVTKKREGQTKGLLQGMRLAKYPVIITIDSDLENNPKHIPELTKQNSRIRHRSRLKNQNPPPLRKNRLQNPRKNRRRHRPVFKLQSLQKRDNSTLQP